MVWALEDIKTENPIENQMYAELEKCKKADKEKNERISEIIEMLSTAEIFPQSNFEICNLHKALQWLSQEQCEDVKEYILVLKDYCDAIGIRSVLKGADINGIETKVLLENPVGSDLSKNAKECQFATFVRRLQLMTTYICEIANIRLSETETLGEKYWIQSTGSDPHCKGRHALFLVNKITNEIEYVYKPHDLSADNAVVGTDGMLAKINNFFRDKNLLVGTPLEGKDAFATVHIDTQSHLEDFVVKESKMTKQEAKEYFYKAGMLQVITDAMAVTDLHQDNIMPTEDGSLIIDAEVDFFRANTSGLISGLTWVDSKKYPRTACFWIDEGNGNIVHSGEAFQNSGSSYRAKYKDGQEFMLKQINDNKAFFLKEIDNQLKNVTKARILPMSTQYFSDLLQRSMRFNRTLQTSYVPSVILTGEDDDKHSTNELASDIINKIKKKFADKTELYIFTGKTGVYLRENEFVKSMMETFENGTIIAMYIDMEGNIYLDDSPIGYLYELGDKSTEPKKLSKAQIIEMIKDNFEYKINNYTISNGG